METVLTLPIFFILIFAIVEFGFVFRDYTTVNAAATEAARAATVAGDDLNADHHTLGVLADTASALPDDVVESIVIYVAATPDDPVPPACLTGSVAGLCNRYTVTDHQLDVGDFGCRTDKNLDRYACPTDRDVTQANATFIGVHIQARRQLLTGWFGTSMSLSATEVLRVEPRER